MSTTLLDALYKEYKELKEKLDGVSDLITKYGGKIPGELKFAGVVSMTTLPEMTKPYPKGGSWKEKIKFVLEQFDRPMTAKEIAFEICNLEVFNSKSDEVPDISHIQNMATQYTSAMAGSSEIGVDKSEFRNKYFLTALS